MPLSQPSNILDKARTYSTAQNLAAANTAHMHSHPRKLVSIIFPYLHITTLVSCQLRPAVDGEQDRTSDECSSLLSGPGDVDFDNDAASKKSAHKHCLDITGLALLYKLEFWQLWILMALLTGVGLMTIKYVHSQPSEERR